MFALPVVLALEVGSGQALPRLCLTRDEAAELAGFMAADLRALLPRIDEARLAVAGTLLDPVEMLRPGFPVWAALDELSRRVPRAHLDHVVAFGSHDGQMPAPALQPEPGNNKGALRLLPISILAPEALAAELAEDMEIELVGRGEAGKRTADWLMRTFGVQLEHARYFSRNDLLALLCVQYEQVNLAALWMLLEAALLTPERELEALSARGLELRQTHGHVLAQTPTAWLASQPATDAAALAHAFAGLIFELRQHAALLGAHHVPFGFDSGNYDVANGHLVEHLAQAEPSLGAAALYAHEAPGLGVIAVTVAQAGVGQTRVLAHGFPLAGQLDTLCQSLAATHGADASPQRLGQVLLDGEGRLSAP